MTRRILFVDDEPKVLDGLRRMLGGQTDAWDLIFATSAAEAVELLAQKSFDVVVLDIKMPEKNGFELLAEIKTDSRARDIEVIVLTGLQDESLKREALELGANDLLNKPVLREDLIARLNSALRIKSYQDELRAKNSALEHELIQVQKMEVVGMLAAGIVHDLNNILMVIKGHSYLAAECISGDAPIIDNLKSITSAAQHAQEIVRQILGLAKRTTPKLESCHLAAVIDDVLELLKATMSKNIQVDWNGAGSCLQIYADQTQMYQLLMNLCINAMQAMENGGILQISLHDTSLEENSLQSDHEVLPGASVRLEVSDTGRGMDEATLKRIFDPLFTTRASQDGTGIGLFIVQRIVRNHNGLLRVESSQGKGTTFIIYLPMAETVDSLTREKNMEMVNAG